MDVEIITSKVGSVPANDVSRHVRLPDSRMPTAVLPVPESNFSITQPTASGSKQVKPDNILMEFEKMVLSQFLEMMTETTQSKILGDGLSADIFNSYFAKAAAENIVQAGGLGIAASISDQQASRINK